MAVTDNQAKSIDSTDFLIVSASQGVEFLLSGKGKVPLSSCGGKTICLFFSANWCRPCKSFTPQLVQLYDTLKARGKEIEIIFVSFDHEETGFEEHFKRMPWLAVPFDVIFHKELRNRYQVDCIPSLIPLASDGVLIDEDLIGLIEDYGADAFPFTKQRREELKALDESKCQGGKLEELLACEGRDYVVSRDYSKILVSELSGKTVGLYFGAHWSPPCQVFTTQLIEVYSELKTTTDQFEIVLVSTDRDHKEFDLSLRSMPWLVIPYEDRTRQDLCRIFKIKGIPALVLIGPDGKIINTDGKEIVSLYGAMAFPFTESRINEIEASLKKEGDALPQLVEDAKHEHELKLDMAKAYVCDSCKKLGRFWTFSCDLCNFDLHPSCRRNGSTLFVNAIT